jgi:hypothetical protein
MEQFLAA